MAHTTPPVKLGSAATSPPLVLRCPACGGVVQGYVLNGAGVYCFLPCEHPAGWGVK